MVTPGVESFIRLKFVEFAGLSDEQVFVEDVTMATVISRSPQMTNSIDLMESFARTANAVRKEYGVRVRLPALPLDTPVSVVLKAFLDEFEKQEAAA
ncbi:hypothetical protein [Kitasatospora viridis]|uniref:Uncharacterized protein n=1 Tax=Kitasatospora viridis TaxID=281105 RepID=A0A561UJ80_9ACTN|nr:hypothetical protein [Kitasatospora viridis]TWF99405.1 hypothetical protein FHX73_113248 [Kitasatospora viridis]